MFFFFFSSWGQPHCSLTRFFRFPPPLFSLLDVTPPSIFTEFFLVFFFPFFCFCYFVVSAVESFFLHVLIFFDDRVVGCTPPFPYYVFFFRRVLEMAAFPPTARAVFPVFGGPHFPSVCLPRWPVLVQPCFDVAPPARRASPLTVSLRASEF